MAIKLGTSDISKVYLGATEVSKIYLGVTEIYSGVSGASLFAAYKTRAEADGGTVENDTCSIAYLDSIIGTAYNNAKLILYPSGYKASKVYSLKPTNGNGDFAFARSTTKTYEDATNTIDEAAINVMPVSYEGGGCGKFNFEPQATNLFQNSEPASQGGFNTGVVFQQTNIFSKNGIYYGDNSVRRVAFFPSVPIVANVDFTVSVFVKMTDGSVPVYSNVSGTNTNDFALPFSGTPTVGTPILIGNNIYKVFITGQTSNTNFNFFVEKTTNMTNKTFQVTGFNVVQSGSITSYIPAAGSAVTRNADDGTVSPPAGTTQITETFKDGSTNVITTIPATYTVSEGEIQSVVMI